MVEKIPNLELLVLASNPELIRIIECPVCQEIPFPPIYICVRGHNVCKTCRRKLTDCPTCRGKLSVARNYAVEQIVLASKHSCPYKSEGCTTEEMGELMETHFKNCAYRPFTCPAIGWDGCKTNLVELRNVEEHFIKVHFKLPFATPTTSIYRTLAVAELEHEAHPQIQLRDGLSSILWPLRMIQFEGSLFSAQIFSTKTAIFWIVLCIGPEDEARNYRARITCQFGKDSDMQWTVPVKSVSIGGDLCNPVKRSKMFMPSCSLDDFKQMATLDEVTQTYGFRTSYTIIPREESD